MFPNVYINNFFENFFLMFIYFWDRERQSMSRGGAEREGDTESEAGSRIWAVSTEHDARLELTSCESWPELSQMLNELNHPGTPKTLHI